MRKILLLVLSVCLCALFCRAQHTQKVQQFEIEQFDSGLNRDFPWGEYDHANFDMASYPKDPSAHALVLKEFGKAWITSNGNVTTLMFEYHVRVKLYDKQALSRGHVEIPYYIQDNGTYEEINPTSVQGLTYYAIADGSMRSIPLSQDSVAIVKKNKHWSAIVFNMPKLSKGCIIEYKYRFSSPFLDKFKTWEFQSNIPKLYSEFEAHIPTVFKYTITLRGPLKLSKDTVTTETNCFSTTDMRSNCSVEDYRIDDVPAFKPEAFMPSPNSYLLALHFQITRSTVLNNFSVLNQATSLDVAGNWDEADKTLKYHDNFGSQFGRNVISKEKLGAITNGLTDSLEKAKAIFSFVQKNITYDGFSSIYTNNGVKQVLEKHNGNSADINIALINILNQAGIPAEGVILSTRDNGTVNTQFPALTEFNNVIAAVHIGSKVFLLDATDPLAPFGTLPFKDLNMNSMGRVIPLNKPSYWIRMTSSQRIIGVTVADLTLGADNKLTGTINCYAKNYLAYQKKLASSTQPLSNSPKSIPGAQILSASDNAKENSNALNQTFNVEINNQIKSDDFSFTPGMLGKPVSQPYELLDTLTENPFTQPTRTYPVDFGLPCAYSFTFTIHFPENYKLATKPDDISQSVADIGDVISNTTVDATSVTYTITYNLDKPLYSIEEYASLKDLFDKIMQAEKASLIIKKQ